MSAAHQTMESRASLARLTRLNPSSDDLRHRAEFWRRYLATSPVDPNQALIVMANCAAMESQADRMDNPAPIARLAAARPARKPAASKVKGITALEFWDAHSAAVRAIVAVHGPRWQLTAPRETVEVRLPARLCSAIGPLGGKITWRRDQRVPAPSYWPDGALPAGVDVDPPAPRYTGPMGDDHPSLVMIRLARAEQITTDRRLGHERYLARGCTEEAAFSAAHPAMLNRREAAAEESRTESQAWRFRHALAAAE